VIVVTAGAALALSGLVAPTAGATGARKARPPAAPRSFIPETAPGFTNTFKTKEPLVAQCPRDLVGKAGDQSHKVLNGALNTPASFQAGGTVHYTYRHNEHHGHAEAATFEIEDCVVTYPAGFFSPGDFDPTTGVLTNPAFSRTALVNAATKLDSAHLGGFDDPHKDVYFGWVAPATLTAGAWVCNYARDIGMIDTYGMDPGGTTTTTDSQPGDHTTTTADTQPGDHATTTTADTQPNDDDDMPAGPNQHTVPPTCYKVPPAPSTTTTTVAPTTSTTIAPTTTTTKPPPPPAPQVFVGYADTEHLPAFPAGRITLPTPWQGDPGVVFLGCTAPSAACGNTYDAGVVRVDNLATNPALTLTAAKVVIGPCTYQAWDTFLPATLPPGGKLVLTQTGLNGPPQPAPCNGRVALSDRAFTNFDTSEGPFDTLSPPFSNCDPSRTSAPVITLTFNNGMTLTITDAAKVLTTGGVDLYACSYPTSEGTQYAQVPPANVVRTP